MPLTSSVPVAFASRRIMWTLRALCVTLLALHLAAPHLPEAQAWAVWPYTYLPPIWRWLLAALAGATLLPAVANRLADAITTRPGLPTRHRNALFAFIALLCLLPFSLWRIVHTRWGDAYILVNGISYPDPALRVGVSWRAPIDLWLHIRLWEFGQRLWGWTDAWPAYRILSPLAGVLFVFVLLKLADSIGHTRSEKLLIAGLIGTLGLMQIFFGYAENYSLAAAGVLLFLWLALETLAGRRALWQPALALAVTHGLHPSTLVLAPALLYVLMVDARRTSWPRALLQAALPMFIVGGGIWLLMTASGHGLGTLATTDSPGGGDGRWLVPLRHTATRWEHYTLFSAAHLLDWLNSHLLSAPVTLGSLLILAAAAWRQRIPAAVSDAEIRFLFVATAGYWLFTWIWNPDYGGQRDWDLFSLAALPGTLLLARALPRFLRARATLNQAAVMLIAVSAIHTIAWIYQNTRPWEW
ncbi:MAG: hypothetical protein WAZ19_13320 [Anaerolineae bacterium]